jgi:RNA binding exosome subunit
MSTWPVHYLDIRAFAYATEIDARVREAVQTVINDAGPVEAVDSSGHGGAPITLLQARIERTRAIDTVITGLEGVVGLPPDALRDRITADGELYLSVDKQAAYEGAIEDGDGIIIRSKLEAYPATPENTVAAAAPLIEFLVSRPT